MPRSPGAARLCLRPCIHAAIVGRNVEHDIRIVADKPADLRRQHSIYGEPWHKQAHTACRLVPEPGKLAQGVLNLRERRAQPGAEMLPRVAEGNASRRA